MGAFARLRLSTSTKRSISCEATIMADSSKWPGYLSTLRESACSVHELLGLITLLENEFNQTSRTLSGKLFSWIVPRCLICLVAKSAPASIEQEISQ
jgi:hypothetical protein